MVYMGRFCASLAFLRLSHMILCRASILPELRVAAPVLLGVAVAIVGPAIFGIETVGQQDDHPVIVRILRRRIQNLAMMEM